MNFEVDYLPRLGRRATGFARIFDLLARKRRSRGPLTIVETGCLRALNWEGDGCSSILFHEFAVATGSQFVSVDIQPEHCALARRHCPEAEFH